MAETVNNLNINKYLTNKTVTDFVSKLTITFGIILIIGGIYLMIECPSSSSQLAQTTQDLQPAFSIDLVPGVPLSMAELAGLDAITFGSVSWIIGVDLLLVGLGLWVRHKVARLAAMLIFTLAAFFQFSEFLFLGFLNAPFSFIMFIVNAVFVFFLFSKFDTHTATVHIN
ncbi:MAG: hypothetical protein NWF01_08190 [Candidatus Bathyarchaeota archaeon]|nr:hypothetical protein [Candidatus Bathyarchaeota archaeon]